MKFNRFINFILLFLGLLIAVLGIYILFIFSIDVSHVDVQELRDIEGKAASSMLVENAQIGDFIGGVVGTLFSLAGFFLIYLTYRSQKESSEKDKIEGRFLNLIELHRGNVTELLYRNGRTNVELASGRRVFKEVYEQIKEALVISEAIFNAFDPSIYLKKETRTPVTDKVLRDYAKIAVAYAIVFFGVSKENDNSTLNALSKDFDEEFSKKIIRFFKLVPARYEDEDWKHWNLIIKNKLLKKEHIQELFNDTIYQADLKEFGYELGALKFDSNYEFIYLIKKIRIFYKRFGGHQYKLGHYFRHLFQTVKFIDKQALLSYDDKYEYIKTLRAQLSNYEQYILFFNSISFVGREWELNYKSTTSYDPKRWIISKYNFIKNIPDTNANGIAINKFYNLIDFEFNDKSEDREKFMKYWK